MQRGFILIVVIGVLSVLAFVGIVFVQISHQNKEISQNYILKVRSKNLALSGVEFGVKKYQKDFIFFDDANFVEQKLGSEQGSDSFKVSVTDFNSRININDRIGVSNGKFTTPTNAPLPGGYLANHIDPYKNDNYKFPLAALGGGGSPKGESKSAINHLNVRRLLNAYGDIHRHIDVVYDDKPSNVSVENYYGKPLPTPAFTITETNSSDALRGKSMAHYDPTDPDVIDPEKNMGLGDQIIMARPDGGYQTLEEIEGLVNAWAAHDGVMLSEEYLNGQSFYDLIKSDLSTDAYYDHSFRKLELEVSFGEYHLLDRESLGDFKPLFGQKKPFNLTKGIEQYPISPINLNQASFFVRAAVFYAPTNVSYPVEGATTVPPYLIGTGVEEHFTDNTATEAMMAANTLGVIGPVFDQGKETYENGTTGGRSTHLMSLRDAMHLANAYGKYVNPNKDPATPILSFDDFRDFLIDHETSGKVGNIPAYEKVLANTPSSYQGNDEEDFNAGGLYHVAPFTSNGAFSQDYISKTLPHLFSCVRRLPSWFSVPSALQSPYMVHKPEYGNDDYKNGYLVRQGFRKVEDFVWRFTHPKVCFVPCGRGFVHSIGQVKRSGDGEVLASSEILADTKFFRTKYFRSELDFARITQRNLSDLDDPLSTHRDIVIGPETSTIPMEVLGVTADKIKNVNSKFGFVGLKDFNQDLTEDVLMNYSPDIVMNFTVPDSLSFDPHMIAAGTDLTDFIEEVSALDNENNSGPQYAAYSAALGSLDLWGDELGNGNYPITSALEDLSIEDAFKFAASGTILNSSQQLEVGSAGDVSSFNGVRLRSSKSHGEFTSQAISQSLYWRLDDWLDRYSGEPVGKALSKGLMTFWFQVPSGYDYPTQIQIPGGSLIESESFSRVLAHLNFWEKYVINDSGEEIERPISLTLGIKKTQRRGLNVFMRYDSGGEHHDGSTSFYADAGQDFDYKGPVSLNSSSYNNLLETQYDILSLFVSDDPAGYTYDTYRIPSHRSSEVNVKLANTVENGPGSWHRVSAYWNLKWDEAIGSGPDPDDQLYLVLHDSSNTVGEPEFRQGVASPPDLGAYTPGAAYPYPGDESDVSAGSNVGFMLPYDSSMILNLGESFARRLGDFVGKKKAYRLRDKGKKLLNPDDDVVYSSDAGEYYPFWCLDSTIDNFRLWMGPSDPSEFVNNNDPSTTYFDATNLKTLATSGKYSALRYNVVNKKHSGFTETVQPTWVIDPNWLYHEFPSHNPNPPIGVGSEIVSIGTRVYYPPDTNDNIPYVYLSASNKKDGTELKPSIVSKNEQMLVYEDVKTTEDFRIRLQYTAYKPVLDGDQSNRESKPLVYSGSDHFTDIPWIKEISIRWVPASGAQYLSWAEGYQEAVQLDFSEENVDDFSGIFIADDEDVVGGNNGGGADSATPSSGDDGAPTPGGGFPP